MTTLVSQEPLFYGHIPYAGKGTSAEDFIGRINNWATAQTWNNQVKTAQAMGFLRDDAAHFFKHVLECKDAIAFAAINGGDWDVFERTFKAAYFQVRTTFDLSADWSNLKQKPNEAAHHFAGRIGGKLIQYANLLPEAPFTDQDWAAFRVVLDPATGAAAAATINELRAIRAELVQMWQRRRKEQQRVAYFDLGYKILAAGLTNKTLVAKVRAKEREIVPYGNIIDFLEREEANMGNPNRPVDNAPHKTHLPTVGGTIAAVDDDEDYQAGLAALNARFGKGKGKGQAKQKAKPTQKTQQQGQPKAGTQSLVKDYSKPGFGLPCKHCKKTGHWQNECPQADVSQTQVHAAGAAASSVDARYQQFLALEAQHYGQQVGSINAEGPAYEALYQGNANAGV